jgi:hypothetical protein
MQKDEEGKILLSKDYFNMADVLIKASIPGRGGSIHNSK